MEHRASVKSFQALRSPAIPLTSPHDLVLLVSSSIVLRHVLFGLPLLLYPWGFQSNAVFSIAPVSLRSVCPIQFHFLLFIWFSIEFWWVILHIACQNCTVYSVFPSGMTSHSKIAQFNWECIGRCTPRDIPEERTPSLQRWEARYFAQLYHFRKNVFILVPFSSGNRTKTWTLQILFKLGDY